MRFDLRSKVMFISCSDINTWEKAFECIEKMYRHAYGPRAGKPLYADGLTPNEERLTIALVEKFSTRNFGYSYPLSVDCGEHTYVFCHIIPYEGVYYDFLY